MTWRSFKCSEASAINIPGYRKRAYCGSGGTKIYNESTDDYSKYSPVFVIYKNKNNMTIFSLSSLKILLILIFLGFIL